MMVLDTREYIGVLRQLVEEGREVSCCVSGGSMAPFLADGRDYVLLTKAEDPLRRGDVVFFERSDGRFILHRILKCTPQGYYMVGDGQSCVEGPVAREQVFAKLKAAKRKGVWIGPGNFWWEFFARVWICLVPFRKNIQKAYLFFRRTK